MLSEPAVIGKYRIEQRIGQGGMGTVYRARDTRIGRDVAIKLLRVDDDEMRQRFEIEAQSAGRLKHPNIVTIYDYADYAGNPCLVMEFVEGETLATLIRGGAPMTASRRFDLIEQVCRGLAFAHRAGIVHRDVKPSNLMVDSQGTAKILDFGIARNTEGGLTRSGSGRLIGTAAYMSPEQIRGGIVDGRCDIFALGAVLFELLSGKRAFQAGSDYALYELILSGRRESFVHPDAELRDAVAPVFDAALAANPADRYPDAEAFAADLRDLRDRFAHQAANYETVIEPLNIPPSTPRLRLRAPTPPPTPAPAAPVQAVGPADVPPPTPLPQPVRPDPPPVAPPVVAPPQTPRMPAVAPTLSLFGGRSLSVPPGERRAVRRTREPAWRPSAVPRPTRPLLTDPAQQARAGWQLLGELDAEPALFTRSFDDSRRRGATATATASAGGHLMALAAVVVLALSGQVVPALPPEDPTVVFLAPPPPPPEPPPPPRDRAPVPAVESSPRAPASERPPEVAPVEPPSALPSGEPDETPPDPRPADPPPIEATTVAPIAPAAPTGSGSDAIVDVPTIRAQLIKNVRPKFPPEALAQGVKSASVELEIVVLRTGKVGSVRLVRGPELFVAAAIDAAEQWEFRPARLRGEPVATRFPIIIEFGVR